MVKKWHVDWSLGFDVCFAALTTLEIAGPHEATIKDEFEPNRSVDS
jgi:hypothetical protein